MERLTQENDFGQNRKAADELPSFTENHVSNLFDVNEDINGEKYDLATGTAIDNSSLDNAQDDLSIIQSGIGDVLPPLRDEDDEAARWLKQHGG